MISREKLEEKIRQLAYEIYVQSGCIPGKDLDNWLQAEKIVIEKYSLIKNEKTNPEPEVTKAKKTAKKECTTKTSKTSCSSKKVSTKTTRKK